jgi:phage-related minor tail protein
MQLSTVGMIDSAKATEYLISTMKGWKLGVDDMEGVIDKMAELDRNAAISAGDIAEAMSRSNVSA